MSEQVEIHNSRRPVPHVIEAIARAPWAITEEGIAQIMAIAERENEITPEAISKIKERRQPGSEALINREGVAIINVRGPIIRYGDFFTAISGGSTYQGIREDLDVAASTARAVLFHIDSPGGEVNGCAELAEAIRDVAGKMPVEAYVGGQACSAAYWLASAANQITGSPSAIFGSIGVRMGFRDTRAADAARGIRSIEFVSSRAPNKRLDVDSDEGRARIQRTADGLEDVFISAVAKYRGVSEETVASEFGAGGVEVAREALELGMVDAIGNFEATLLRLQQGGGRKTSVKAKVKAMSEKTFTQAEYDAAIAKARTEGQASADSAATDSAVKAAEAASHARVKAILTSEEAVGRTELANHLAFDSKVSADEAIGMLKLAPKGTAPAAAPAASGTGAGGRAKEAPNGLATGDEGDSGEKNAPKESAINSAGIYDARRKAMGGRA